MLKHQLFLILILAAASANVGPKVYEQKDMGPPSLKQFTYSMSVNCTAATLRVIVMDGKLELVQGASTYLKYIDFSQPLISSEKSDENGWVIHKLPGNVSLMRGFFVLVIQKEGYKNKEIHLDLSPCFSDDPIEEPAIEPPPPEPLPVVETKGSQPLINQSDIVVEEDEPEVCPVVFVPLLMLFKFRR